MSQSAYIKAMHPKTEMAPTSMSISKALNAGWVAQTKIHGHRAQIHICADEGKNAIVYNRQGKPHKKLLSPKMIQELRRILDLKKGWTVLDSEWLKPEEKLFLFDVLKKDDVVLHRLNYLERFELLPRDYISPYVSTLPVLKSVSKCLDVLSRPESYIEGLVFKSLKTKGFDDSAIIRCRKRP